MQADARRVAAQAGLVQTYNAHIEGLRPTNHDSMLPCGQVALHPGFASAHIWRKDPSTPATEAVIGNWAPKSSQGCNTFSDYCNATSRIVQRTSSGNTLFPFGYECQPSVTEPEFRPKLRLIPDWMDWMRRIAFS